MNECEDESAVLPHHHPSVVMHVHAPSYHDSALVNGGTVGIETSGKNVLLNQRDNTKNCQTKVINLTRINDGKPTKAVDQSGNFSVLTITLAKVSPMDTSTLDTSTLDPRIFFFRPQPSFTLVA